MTSQQITLLVLLAAGVTLFFAGRYLAKKFTSEEPVFLPALMVSVRGIASYTCTLISWSGAILAAAIVLIFIG